MTLIGIVGKMTTAEGFGIHPHYVNYFSQFGTVVLLAPMLRGEFEPILSTLDMLVLPGGADISPTQYGDTPLTFTEKSDPVLEYFDHKLLPFALTTAKLVVGICRGHQSIAVRHGFKLDQNVGAWHPRSETWYDNAHKVRVFELGKDFNHDVNSLHHQALVIDRARFEHLVETGDRGYRPLAADTTLKNLYVVEAAEGSNWLSVQWHPEATNDQLVTDWITTRLSGHRVIK